MRVLTLGNCINWQLVEFGENTFALRCSSTGTVVPFATDAEGGLLLPEGVTFEEETATSATA